MVVFITIFLCRFSFSFVVLRIEYEEQVLAHGSVSTAFFIFI